MTQTVQEGILRTLKRGDHLTSSKLAESLNATMPAVSIALGVLYDKDLVHIADWKLGAQNHLMRVYAFGKGEDAVRPADKPERKKKVIQKTNVVRADVAASWLFNLVGV